MTICKTDKELERALEAKENRIIFEGPKASAIIERIEETNRKKRAARNTAVGVGILCLLAAPFTGGGSLFGLGATAGAVALSEGVILAIISAVVTVSIEAIKAIKDYEIHKLDRDRIELIRK